LPIGIVITTKLILNWPINDETESQVQSNQSPIGNWQSAIGNWQSASETEIGEEL
jgi:hypothetical protein